jgi:hypothetical protein
MVESDTRFLALDLFQSRTLRLCHVRLQPERIPDFNIPSVRKVTTRTVPTVRVFLDTFVRLLLAPA